MKATHQAYVEQLALQLIPDAKKSFGDQDFRRVLSRLETITAEDGFTPSVIARWGASIRDPLRHQLNSHFKRGDWRGVSKHRRCRIAREKGSVVDRMCRLHEASNCFVVDSSFRPTGLGLNPTVTAVANALRVGTSIADAMSHGGDPVKR